MKKISLLTLFILFISNSSLAVKVTNLYQADLPVTSQTDDERAEAVKKGFVQVLVKLTGDPDVMVNPALKPAIRKADYYVQEYNYAAPSTDSSMHLLHVNYDATDVERLLHKAGVNYWGERRPLLLVWLVLTGCTPSMEVIGEETPSLWVDSMRQQGKLLGLPLIFPLMDVTDINEVTPEDIISLDLPTLKKAGARYAPTGYLIGVIAKNDENNYQSKWHLILQKQQWAWTTNNRSLEEAGGSALAEVSQTLVKRFGYNSNLR